MLRDKPGCSVFMLHSYGVIAAINILCVYVLVSAVSRQ